MIKGLSAGYIVLSILTIDVILRCVSLLINARAYSGGWLWGYSTVRIQQRQEEYSCLCQYCVDVFTVKYRPFPCPFVQVNQETVLSPFGRARDFFGCKECDEMGVLFPCKQASSDGMHCCNIETFPSFYSINSLLIISSLPTFHTYLSVYALCLYASIWKPIDRSAHCLPMEIPQKSSV